MIVFDFSVINPKISYGDILKCFRIINNLEQKEVADIIGTYLNTIFLLEKNNKGTLETIRKLADIYRVGEEDFVFLYKKANKNGWNFQKVLYEALKIFMAYPHDEFAWKEDITLGEIVRCFRRVNQMYMKEVAEKLNISKSSLSLLENAKRKIDDKNLEGFANIYGVNVEDFYSLQRLSNHEKWSYQRLLLEILNITFSYPSREENYMKNMIKTNPTIIRAFRTFYDLSQEELSTRMGHSSYLIRSIEKGKRSLTKDSLKAFCKVIDVECEDVLRIQKEAEYNQWPYERIMLEIALNWKKNVSNEKKG